jgi:hypothetical protein
VYADVGVDAHAAFLHLGVGGADGEEDGVVRDVLPLRSAERMSGRLTISTSGHTGGLKSISEVAAMDATTGAAEVRALAGVLLHVGPFDADPRAVGKGQEAVDVERLVVLADLVGLRHVGIEVVLAVERARLDGAVQCHSDAHGQLDCLAVQHRQRARQAERDRVDVGVGLVAVRSGWPRTAVMVANSMHLETDHCSVAGQASNASLRRPHCAALSSAAAARNICGSSTFPPAPAHRPADHRHRFRTHVHARVAVADSITPQRYYRQRAVALGAERNATLGDAGVNSTSACW